VSEEKGRVHYQLSITGGQAGAFFLGLLVALCLAFFFGMKTGATSRRVPDTVARLAAASDIPVPTPADASDAGDAASAAPKRPAPTEPPLGFDEPPAVKPPVRGEAASRDGAPQAKPAARPTREAEVTQVKPTAAPVVPAPATPHPTLPHGAPHAAAGEEWFVQVLATQKPETADATAKRLKANGYASDVSPVPGKEGLFRVRVGPFKDRASADDAAARVAKNDVEVLFTSFIIQ